MKIEYHEQMKNGQWRKGRFSHPCDTVIYFGVKPHKNCMKTTGKNQMYFDTGQLIGSAPFITHKLCRFCAQMELSTSLKMTYEERKAYIKTVSGGQ